MVVSLVVAVHPANFKIKQILLFHPNQLLKLIIKIVSFGKYLES